MDAGVHQGKPRRNGGSGCRLNADFLLQSRDANSILVSDNGDQNGEGGDSDEGLKPIEPAGAESIGGFLRGG